MTDKETKTPKAKKAVELTKESIFDASTSEIREFAKTIGLDFTENASRDYMIQEIFENEEWDAYKPEDDATHVELTLAKTKDDKHPYQGGLNGKMFSIKRGVRVRVPVGYYNTMIDAAQMAYRVENLAPDEANIAEGGNAHKRIALGELPMTVHRFLTLEDGSNKIEVVKEN